MTAERIVIVGGGLAGAKAAVALKEGGFAGSLTIVGDERHPPYERPPLSKDYLQGASTADDMLVVPAAWYDDNDVVRIEGVTAESIDREHRRVHLSDGQELPYDALILATGASPRRLDIPGKDLALTLRSVEDSDELKAAYADASTVVIIGGGWIGLETAAAARAAGVDTVLLEREPLPLQQVLGDELGGYFADLHRRNDVDLRTSSSVESISGSGPYVVRTDGGDIEADVVVMGVGAAPRTELAERAGLATDNGVIVDESFRTSDPAIYAVGDVANAYNAARGESLRVEHWDNAIRQGEAVAKVVLGGEVTYDWQPYFFSDQFDLGMEYVGRSSASDEVVIRGDKDSGEFIAFWLGDGRVTAAMNVNVWDVNDDLRALIGRRVDLERLVDPDVPLGEGSE
ncbi:FAD-dependent oxidoreductase [Aeromicrobium panaciterrae]|uniref:NAD(P)/FAD-dependent oxidoreductase n=1 Tax=Aeromicrobium panaciterrae TaxID=363861 RepID=UPI0031D03A9F